MKPLVDKKLPNKIRVSNDEEYVTGTTYEMADAINALIDYLEQHKNDVAEAYKKGYTEGAITEFNKGYKHDQTNTNQSR